MHIFKNVNDIRLFLNQKTERIGFVPTMGALHEGHASLLKASLSHSDITVCSIFVNPTQFNDSSDFDKYPITTNTDIEFLEKLGVDILFLPTVAEIYPDGVDKFPAFDFKTLNHSMEGAFRKGHFEGMVQVVDRLLQIVKPDHLYMGQKDLQQFNIVSELIIQKKYPIELRVGLIKRETSGLAMSSRNQLLSKESKENAAVIFKSLSWAKEQVEHISIDKITKQATQFIFDAGGKVEYFTFVDGTTLLPVDNLKNATIAYIGVAAYFNNVRLIDNIPVKGIHIAEGATFFVPNKAKENYVSTNI